MNIMTALLLATQEILCLDDGVLFIPVKYVLVYGTSRGGLSFRT
jgi:hypothetical protein